MSPFRSKSFIPPIRTETHTNNGMKKDFAATLKRQYGITVEYYLELLETQGYTCAICQTSKWGNKSHNSSCVDHDHHTGKVRGLLCNNCNTGLGMFKDDSHNLTKAIDYLSKHKYDTTF